MEISNKIDTKKFSKDFLETFYLIDSILKSGHLPTHISIIPAVWQEIKQNFGCDVFYRRVRLSPFFVDFNS